MTTYDQGDLLDAIHSDPSPWAVDDRERIEAAWRACAERNGGVVNPNHVRKHLTNDIGNLTVSPRRLSASYNSRLLERDGEVRSDDTAGRNRGAVINSYRFRETP